MVKEKEIRTGNEKKRSVREKTDLFAYKTIQCVMEFSEVLKNLQEKRIILHGKAERNCIKCSHTKRY